MKSFKVEVLAYGESEYVANQLRFATEQEARAYGENLADRWTMVKDWRVAESPDEVTS